MRELYEVDTPPDDVSVSISPTCPALWRYRTQVTLDHLSHTFQHEVASTDPERNKVLAEFLRQVNKYKGTFDSNSVCVLHNYFNLLSTALQFVK